MGTHMSVMESLESRRMLSAAGQLDTTFDGDGRSPMSFGAGQLIGIQPGGKIVLQRTDVGGAQDSSFGTGGKATLTSTPNTLVGLAVTADNSVLTAVDYSTYNNGYFNDLRVNKFTASGKADSTYGAGAGYIDVASSTDYGLRSLAFYVNRADGV